MANRGVSWDPHVHTIADLKDLGSKKLPKIRTHADCVTIDYFNEGAMDLVTLRDNEEAYNRYKIRPRILVNVDNVDISSEIFGCKTALPLGFSPAAMHRLAHPDGEIATSRAAANIGICMGLSSYATASLEDVAAQGSGNPYVMQLCVLRDRETTLQMLRRAEGESDKHDFDPSLDWDTAIPWLRQHTKLQLWIKGVYAAEDVQLAIKYGLDGVIVSNHGGRQLDGVPATLDALRECVIAANGKIPVAVDGGIRRGTDIFKALAMGASHCFVGRIPIWGLAYNGQEGVELALKILMYEFKLAMALAGCRTIKDISRSHLAFLNSEGILAKL
ncbi:uncharacterized protein NECHADRAFT_41767 [Fusarium vanettenii 77-13-4]|uniref:FMN hydroxy acid dehydrogenase domain-containing protein n=1 Tax=Fusarium vanettenii (strain ATCC MYA-4622 / CBS 123669 / FGSC 9596 / NRRL 45880 / 77-13-4) TaxID=660122 RepID=C7YT35_FUSV7|nr:uncharacterized protein NECHADRAFT_41767 [Fusarium vanettenii 77-13-4]EEU45754.1 hypothetical protein NECHADRAFT_41767 [Fusarium vanettenii 77-13-4]